SGVAAFPFSRAARVEFSGGLYDVSFTRELRTDTYSADTQQLVNQTVVRSQLADSLRLAASSVALVYDTSYFGATSPILGRRYRLELGQSAGSLAYTTLLADWRQYFMP